MKTRALILLERRLVRKPGRSTTREMVCCRALQSKFSLLAIFTVLIVGLFQTAKAVDVTTTPNTVSLVTLSAPSPEWQTNLNTLSFTGQGTGGAFSNYPSGTGNNAQPSWDNF